MSADTPAPMSERLLALLKDKDLVRQVLEAMREPTTQMMKAGIMAEVLCDGGEKIQAEIGEEHDAEAVWKAMIDAALAPEREGR